MPRNKLKLELLPLDPETRTGSRTGLYYYRARMYDPELGRFMQTDPIGTYDSMNLYQYCGNNPVNWIDPWGEMGMIPGWLPGWLFTQTVGPKPDRPGNLIVYRNNSDTNTSDKECPSNNPLNNYNAGVNPLLEMYKNPEIWEPLGPGIKEVGTGKGIEESYRQLFRNTKTGEIRGIHDLKPRNAAKAKHPHTYKGPSSPMFLWLVPRIIFDAAFPNAPGSIFNEQERRERLNES